MVDRQRIAKWFLYLTCLVVLTCMTQRVAVYHQSEIAIELPNASVNQSSISSDEDPISSVPCKPKLLTTASLVMFETVLLSMGMLFLIQSLFIVPCRRLPPSRVISPTTLRLHLQLCVFRE